MKKFKIIIRYFDLQTRQISLTAKMTTKPITEKRAIEIAKEECAKANSPACWELE